MVVVASNFVVPDEDSVILATPNTKLIVNDQEVGTATLYITQDVVVWGGGFTPTGVAASTVSLLYPTISLHAIQKEPTPALYLQLNYELELPELQPVSDNQENQNENDEGNSADDSDDDGGYGDVEPITQIKSFIIRFVPENEASLHDMFVALLSGQALHPDPEDSEDDFFIAPNTYEGDDGDDNDMFEDAEESSAEQAASRLQQMYLDNANGHQENGNSTENGSQ